MFLNEKLSNLRSNKPSLANFKFIQTAETFQHFLNKLTFVSVIFPKPSIKNKKTFEQNNFRFSDQPNKRNERKNCLRNTIYIIYIFIVQFIC